MNYYNEFDPKASAWLQQLIDDKQIPYDYVDSRSILEVHPSDLSGFTQCHFFAGVGGWSLALHRAGWSSDEPIWTASLPCQPFSTAGKQLGTDDERHLVPTFLDLVSVCRPPVILGEQVASKLARTDWFPGIRLELEALGHAVGVADLCSPCAGEVGEGRIVRGDSESWERVILGKPHIRQRLYWVADANRERRSGIDPLLRSKSAGGAGEGEILEAAGRGTTHGLAHTNVINGDGTGSGAGDDSRQFRSADALRAEHGVFGIPDPVCGRREMAVHPEQASRGETGIRQTDMSRNSGTPQLLPYRDGKTRRTQSGIFPLVDGIPRGVVPSGDPNDPSYANGTAEARAVRLKGYGNAIQIDTATFFIRSTMEVIHA